MYDQLCSRECLLSAWKSLQKRPQSLGFDNVTIQDFKNDLSTNIDNLSDSLKAKNYEPIKLLPHLLNKPEGGYRLLRIPAVKDRVVQKALVNLISEPLDKVYEINNNGVSFAYVKNGSVEKAAIQIRDYWLEGYKYVYKADIKKFFDNINKQILMEKIVRALPREKDMHTLIHTFLNNDVENIKQIVDKAPHLFSPNPLIGIAQGSPLSPLFANVYLAEFDQRVKNAGFKMVRYADDLVILAKSVEAAESAHNFVKEELKELGLKVHELKVKGQLPAVGQSKPKYSEVTRYQDLQFLGLTFKSAKIFPTGRSYQNAIKSVRSAAYDTGLAFNKKLYAVEARINGWCSAYSFAEHEAQKLGHNDKLLSQVLRIMLKKHGLLVKKGVSPHKALGINNYTSQAAILRNKRKKKAAKK